VTFIPRPSQQAILEYRGGKMGVAAVPGSGKTHTLSALAAQLIRQGKLAEDQEVLIVTLVNSAVDNFERRIKGFLGLPVPLGYRVRTLHGLAHDIVREKPAAVGLEEHFAIVDEREAALILREAVQAYLHTNPAHLESYLQADISAQERNKIYRQDLPQLLEDVALAFIRTAKDRRLTPEQLRARLNAAPAPLPLAEMGLTIYSDYQRALAYRGAVDFDDLIRLALDLLENDAEYLERLRYRWPYILEDEAQDSSELQEQILRLLAGPAGNWVRVGDPNQAIYETFTTASPRHLLAFLASEAQTRRELPESGRSQPAIIRLANGLIDWVRTAHPEPAVCDALTLPHIRPAPPDDPQPNPPEDRAGVRLVGRKYSPATEIDAVVASLERWLPEHPEATVAVLVPSNQRGAAVIEALRKRHIACVELLASTSSTRLAAERLATILEYLAEPTSAPRLAKAYLAWQQTEPAASEWVDETSPLRRDDLASLIRKCPQVETFIAPTLARDWLSEVAQTLSAEERAMTLEELETFRRLVRRWQGATLLPVDQLILALGQDLFTSPADLALTHKLALLLDQAARTHPAWQLSEFAAELQRIARNERRFIGFSLDDSGFDPERHRGKVVVATIHKAKGLEWDRVYLMSINNYDFPAAQPNDRYIAEKWFIRNGLNLQAEALAQLKAALATGEYEWYREGEATQEARLDYVRERLRLFYVGITRARKDLIITWNNGRYGDQTQALAFVALQGWWEQQGRSG
jgi:DNA helicase-2/ATP-dependent DNA helicase PcrA